MPDVAMLALGKACIVRGINVGPKQMLEELVSLVVNKELQPPVEKIFGFSRDEVISAYDYLDIWRSYRESGHYYGVEFVLTSLSHCKYTCSIAPIRARFH